MRGIDGFGKAPIGLYSASQGDSPDDSPVGPAVGVQIVGPSSCPVVEQTRSEPQESTASASRTEQQTDGVPPSQPELLGETFERLSPIDLLMASQKNHQLAQGGPATATRFRTSTPPLRRTLAKVPSLQR